MERLDNKSRALYLDLTKATAMLIMPFLHCVYFLGFEGFFASEFPIEQILSISGVLYNFVPGIFLFCLGCGAVITRHDTPEAFLSRGKKLILLGIGLNILRFTPFYLIKGLVFGEMEGFSRAWLWIIGSDVLPFAGLSFLWFAGVKKWNLPDWAVLGFGIVCAAGQMLLPVPRISGTLGQILGNFIFVDGGGSYFPFISWIIFPCLGYFYQSRLNKTRHPARFHVILGTVCASLLAASVLLMKRFGRWKKRYLLWGEMDFHMDLPTTWIAGLIGGLWISISYFLAMPLKRLKISNLITLFSKRITSYYCIHWLVLMGGILIYKLRGKPKKIRTSGAFFAIGTALTALSTVISIIYTSMYRKERN